MKHLVTHSVLGSLGVALAASAAVVSAQVVYPGSNPGPARVLREGAEIIVSNAAVSVSWLIGTPGLRPQFIRDPAHQKQISFTGEVFEIILTNGQRYAASALQPDGPPSVSELVPAPQAAGLAARIPGQQVTVPLRSADGQLRVAWRALMHDGGNYIRQEMSVTAEREDCVIREIVWLSQAIPGAETAGQVDGSLVVAGNFFLGSEDPHALNQAQTPGQASGAGSSADAASVAKVRLAGRGGFVLCRLPRNAVLKRGETLTQSFVLGVVPAGQMRRAFLHYLERERAHPYRPFLHYNSWYDTAWDPFALNETNSLEAIRLFGERFIKPHSVTMDSMVFDDGWDDPKTLWQFHSGFPRGFAPLANACKEHHMRLGMWLSPFGGYGKPKEQRIQFGREEGYELNATGFSLAGPKYYAAFKAACVNMIHKFGVNHFKFDGIATGMYATGGAQYVLDTEAMRRLMLELRREDPNLYINLTTGSWPSPFWLRYADSLWRQGQDMGFSGKGPKQQQWITYRDQETYRNIVRKGPLYPLNSLMTQGVAYSRHGLAGDPAFNSAGFKDDVRAFFGSGTGLQELYIQPGKLTPDDWSVLAEAAKWSRANADVLVDTHWIGGDPGQSEVYGWASWAPRQGIVTLRNPDDQPREFVLDVASVFELPPGAKTKYTLRSPWAEDTSKPALTASAGKPVSLGLTPFEVVILMATPAAEGAVSKPGGKESMSDQQAAKRNQNRLTPAATIQGGEPDADSQWQQVALVPQPVRLKVNPGEFRFTDSTRVVSRGPSDAEAAKLADCLRTATNLRLLLSHDASPGDVVLEHVPALAPKLGAEGYRLAVTTERVLIQAASDAGLFYGGVTLQQLLPAEAFGATPAGQTDPRWTVPCVEIEDFPRFPWRGLLLDIARHYMPVEFVKKFIDLAALHKLNMLQLHLTDDQGWRIEIKRYPRLTEIGSLRAESPRKGDRNGGDATPYGPFFYTQSQIRELVAYARARHVTLVPEIEMPGHFLSALAAYPQLSCTGGPFQVRTRWGIEPDVLCAGSDEAIEFALNVLAEVTDLFPSRFIHIGGDEAPRDRWKLCPRCQARMRTEGLQTEAQLQTYLNRRVEQFLTGRGCRLIGWDEILEGGLTPGAVVMSWRGTEGGLAAASAGHDVVMSPTSHCYLDYAQGQDPGEPEAIGGFLPLEKVYAFEPMPIELPEARRKHILGLQGNLWTEYLRTPRDVEYFAFPRAVALAEVAWSPAASRNLADFQRRLQAHLRSLDRLEVNYHPGTWQP